MALSCRAQAFSMDNLLRNNAKTTTHQPRYKTDSSTDDDLISNPSPNSAEEHLENVAEQQGKYSKTWNGFLSEITVKNSTRSSSPARCFQEIEPTVSSDTSFDDRFPLKVIGEASSCNHTSNKINSPENGRGVESESETASYIFSCPVNKHRRLHPELGFDPRRSTLMYKLPTEPPSHPVSSSPGSPPSSCFCYGELSFCHHPGTLSVPDAHGSDSSIMAELCHADLWSSFHRLGTEMIITKSGRRMFPAMKLRVLGLKPEKLFVVRLEFLQPDTRKYRYIYHSSRWMVSGSGDSLSTPKDHLAPEGPVSGHVLASQVISFERLKLTNTEQSKSGQVSLVSMQKFQPQVVIQEVGPGGNTDVEHTEKYVILFPQTSFMAVTAYQNQQITTLKIASNPFAKGFRDSGKTRLPYDTLLSSLPSIISFNNSLNYFHSPSKAFPWRHCYMDRACLSQNKEYCDRNIGQDNSSRSSPAKVLKMEPGVENSENKPHRTKTTSLAESTRLEPASSVPTLLPEGPHTQYQIYLQQQQQQQRLHFPSFFPGELYKSHNSVCLVPAAKSEQLRLPHLHHNSTIPAVIDNNNNKSRFSQFVTKNTHPLSAHVLNPTNQIKHLSTYPNLLSFSFGNIGGKEIRNSSSSSDTSLSVSPRSSREVNSPVLGDVNSFHLVEPVTRFVDAKSSLDTRSLRAPAAPRPDRGLPVFLATGSPGSDCCCLGHT